MTWRLLASAILLGGLSACVLADGPIALDDEFGVSVDGAAIVDVLVNDHVPPGVDHTVEIVDDSVTAGLAVERTGEQFEVSLDAGVREGFFTYRIDAGEFGIATARARVATSEIRLSIESAGPPVVQLEDPTITVTATAEWRLGDDDWEAMERAQVDFASEHDILVERSPRCEVGVADAGQCGVRFEATEPGVVEVSATVAGLGRAEGLVSDTSPLTLRWVDLSLQLEAPRATEVGTDRYLIAGDDGQTPLNLAVTLAGDLGVEPLAASGTRVSFSGLVNTNCTLGSGNACAPPAIAPGPGSGPVTAEAVVMFDGHPIAVTDDIEVSVVAFSVALSGPVGVAPGEQIELIAEALLDRGDGPQPLSDVEIRHAAGDSTGSCTTDDQGQCVFEQAPLESGRLTVIAAADIGEEGTTITAEAEHTVSTVQGSIEIAGPSTAELDEGAGLTIHARLDTGDGLADLAGETVTLSTTGGGIGTTECTTGNDGRCTISLAPSEPGQVNVTATLDAEELGVPVEDSDSLSVQFIDIDLSVLLSADRLRVNQATEAVATATVDDGSGPEPTPITIVFTGVTSNQSTRSCTTTAVERCVALLTSGNPGSGGADFVVTHDGLSRAVSTRTIVWVDAALTLSCPAVTAPAAAVCTATVLQDTGSGSTPVAGAAVSTVPGARPPWVDVTPACATGNNGTCQLTVIDPTLPGQLPLQLVSTFTLGVESTVSVEGVQISLSDSDDVRFLPS